MMMSSKPTQSFVDPVAHGKFPRVERTVDTALPAGLPKSQDLPRYVHEEPVNYSGTYFSYSLSGHQGSDAPPHWNPSGTCLQTSRSPVIHPPGAGRSLSNQIVHRPDSMANCVESSPSPTTQNQKPAYYDRAPEKLSPSMSGIHAPAAVRKLSVGGTGMSSHTESPVGLAIPRPVYGHNPCCTDHGCSSGPCYGIERGLPRIHPNVYEEEWMLHYGPLSLLQRKEREALLQQRLLQLEQSGMRFPLRESRPEGYDAMRPPGPMRLPPFTEPNYSGFPYTSPTHSPLSPSSDLFHRLQIPSKVHQGLPPSPSCSYEEMQHMSLSHPGITPKMYPDCSPIPRYTQLPQRPVFYYPQGHAEIENATAYKGVGRKLTPDPVPTANKQSPSNPLGPSLVPQPVLRDFPPPGPVAAAGHPFHRHCEQSPFQVYRMHTATGQKRTYSKGPGAPLLVPHAERPVDYSSQRALVMSPPTELGGQPLSPGAFHPVQPHSSYRSSDYMSVAKCKMLASRRSEESVHTTEKDVIPPCAAGHPQRGAGPNAGLSSLEHPSSLCEEIVAKRKHQEDGSNNPVGKELHSPRLVAHSDDVYQVEVPSKETSDSDQQQGERLYSPPSPPMPVINKVFSLAPYKAYLEASGMLPLQNGGTHCNPHPPEPDTQSRTNDQKEDFDELPHRSSPADCSQSPDGKDSINILEPQKIKTEKTLLRESCCSLNPSEKKYDVGQQVPKETVVKEEEADEVSSSSDSVLDLSVKKGEFDMSVSEIQTTTNNSPEYQVDTSVRHEAVDGLPLNGNVEQSLLAPPSSKPLTPTLRPPETKVFFQQIPQQCVKMSAFKVVLPDVLRPHISRAPEVLSNPESKPSTDSSRQARHRFMEFHQSLFRLISSSVSCTPEEELRAWLEKVEPLEPDSPPAKTPRISGLLGVAAREVWLRCGDMSATLTQVISRLEGYVSSRQCPFPHVIRAGMVFIPMLVVKESLFPQVPGTLIDQVLQEHHVELRPTTLSEERHLTQLQRRACSSKMRRLLSLKHLPDIYPDVLNLFYHACVSKRLGLIASTTVKKEKPEYSEEAENPNKGVCKESTASRPNPPDPPRHLKEPERGPCVKKHKRKNKRRSALKSRFLGKEKTPGGENSGYSAQSESWSIVNPFSQDRERSPNSCGENSETLNIKQEENSCGEEVPQECKEEPESTWGPVTSDDLSSGNSDTETERASAPLYQSQPSDVTKSHVMPKSHSGMILKLRKVLFNKGPFRRDPSYQPVSDHSQPAPPGVSGENEEAGEGEQDQAVVPRRMRPRVARRRRQTGGFSEALRPTRSSSKVLRLRNPLMQLKYCPHLSACHGSRRRRWALRSAMQTARRAMKNQYPELVGKRIRHLYEENDKSEVWYRGVVVRVHEPHLNPLKTVFEVKYDSEPEWQYYLELLMDYKKGWLKVED